MRRLLAVLFVFCFSIVAFAQESIEPLTPVPAGSSLAISYPVPVLTLSGDVTIAGTVNPQNLSNYFVEFRPLVVITGANATPNAGSWFPATLPSNVPILEDVIGIWNTRTAPDGVYEIRLVVSAGGQTQYARVSPLRVLNNPQRLSPFAPQNVVQALATQPASNLQGAQATQAALATLFAFQSSNGGNNTGTLATAVPASTGPTAIAFTNANVRTGDSTLYPTVGSLLNGQSSAILGIASTGSGWYYIQLPSGRRGFISPGTVRVEGNIVGLPIINPPPVPATPTPVATATSTNQADVLLSGSRLEPATPQCNQPFTVFINASNNGSNNTAAEAKIQVLDKHRATGTITASGIATIPILTPGQNWLVGVVLTSTTYVGEEHEITAVVNYDNAIADINPNNNLISIRYTLGAGTC